MVDHVVVSRHKFDERLRAQVSKWPLVAVDADIICEVGSKLSQANNHGLETSIHGLRELSYGRPTSLVPLLEFCSLN